MTMGDGTHLGGCERDDRRCFAVERDEFDFVARAPFWMLITCLM
jgi:hypothetical protein